MKIEIVGEIVTRSPPEEDGIFCVESDVLRQIAEAGGEDIELSIDSIGGSLTAGIKIYRALKAYGGKVTASVEGCACSAASMIMCAADVVEVYPTSLIMIHGVQVSGQTVNSSNVAKLAEDIASIDQAIADIYIARTGQDEATVRDWMNPEKWMSGREAVSLGFADVLKEEKTELTASAKKPSVKVSTDLQEVKGFMATMKAKEEEKKKCAEEGTEEEKEETPAEDSKEPEKKEPEKKKEDEEGDSSESIESKKNILQAVARERKRLEEIDAIADMVSDKELLHEAKYGKTPLTAQELSYKVMLQSQRLGTEFLKAWNSDETGAESVSSIPGESMTAKKAEEKKVSFDSAIERVKAERGKRK